MWHKCDSNKSNLPPVDEVGVSTISVLVTDGKFITEAYYSFEADWWYTEPDGRIVFEHDDSAIVTHWMMKPKLP